MVVLMSTYDVEDLPAAAVGLRRRGVPAQRTPVSRSAEPDMASRRLRLTTAVGSVPQLACAENSRDRGVPLVILLGHDLIHRFRAERFELFLTGHLALWAAPPSCCRCGSTSGCCDRRGCWPSSPSARRSASCWPSGCDWRGAVRYQQSITLVCIGDWVSVSLVTFIVSAPAAGDGAWWRWCPSFSPSPTSAGSAGWRSP